jgi:hypothetical protein
MNIGLEEVYTKLLTDSLVSISMSGGMKKW